MARKIINKIKKYCFNILIALDQLLNALTGGDPDEVISSRIGKIKQRYNGIIPWRYPIARILDFLLEKLDKNHCIEAIEEDEGKDSLME